jgi:hypothetical protein
MRRKALYLLAIAAAFAAPVWLQLTISGEADIVAAVPEQAVAEEAPARPPQVHQPGPQRPPTRRAHERVHRPRKDPSPKRIASVASARSAGVEAAVPIAAPHPAPTRAAPPSAPPSRPVRPDTPSGGHDDGAGATPPAAAPDAPQQGEVAVAPPPPAEEARPEQTVTAPPPAAVDDDPDGADDDDVSEAALPESGLAGASEEELSQWVDELIESSIGDLSELDDG